MRLTVHYSDLLVVLTLASVSAKEEEYEIIQRVAEAARKAYEEARGVEMEPVEC